MSVACFKISSQDLFKTEDSCPHVPYNRPADQDKKPLQREATSTSSLCMSEGDAVGDQLSQLKYSHLHDSKFSCSVKYID
jgi:hypothetical protein